MGVIKAEFGTMRAFLNAWTNNEATKEYRADFLKHGAPQVIPEWLPRMPPCMPVIDIVAQQSESDVARFL